MILNSWTTCLHILEMYLLFKGIQLWKRVHSKMKISYTLWTKKSMHHHSVNISIVTTFQPVFFPNKQTKRKRWMKWGIELQRALICSKHALYNYDFATMMLNKGDGPTHTLLVWKCLEEIRILKNSLQSPLLFTQSHPWVH